jgi:HK97 family phage prohead protease
MKNLQYKSVGEIKDVDVEKRIITGYASKVGNIDLVGDMIMPGAFTKTINERGPMGKNEIWFLHNHSTDSPLGKPSVLKEDNYGLYFESKIVDTEIGSDILKLYNEGLINQHSIGFSTIKQNKVDATAGNPGYYQIQEVKLYEFSSVLWGANPDTPFMGVKSLDAQGLQDRFDKLYKQLKSGNLKDETYELLEIEYNFIKSEIFKLIDQEQKSEDTTPVEVNPVEIERKRQEEFLLQLKNSFK